MAQPIICLLLGGKSPEHAVSVKSGLHVLAGLSREKYRILAVYVDPDGRIGTTRAFFEIISRLEKEDIIPAGMAAGALEGIELNQEPLFFQQLYDRRYDLVFPVFHGRFGEDGSVQGLCDFLQIPYAGCHTAGSALCLDKELTKKILCGAGIGIVEYVTCTDFHWQQNRRDCLAEVEKSLGYPVFCKPARLGSSLGLSRADDPGALIKAADRAFGFDTKIIIEKCLDITEYSVGIIGNSLPEASVPALVNLNPHFYDYAAKYGKEAIDDIIPAPINEATTVYLQQLALKVYRALDLSGMARIDFFRWEDTFLCNEINTIPGFGGKSLFNKMWEKSGLPFAKLLDKLIEYGFQRHELLQSKIYYAK